VINERGEVKIIIMEADALGEDVHVSLPYDEIGFVCYGIIYDITMEELEKMPKVDYED
jgi:hypothetical protein